jgi:hypothetical protein
MSVLSAVIDCTYPKCGQSFEGYWYDDSMDPEQRDEAPVSMQECPLGHKFEAEFPGWSWTTEAG